VLPLPLPLNPNPIPNLGPYRSHVLPLPLNPSPNPIPNLGPYRSHVRRAGELERLLPQEPPPRHAGQHHRRRLLRRRGLLLHLRCTGQGLSEAQRLGFPGKAAARLGMTPFFSTFSL